MDTETVTRLRPGGTRVDRYAATAEPDWTLPMLEHDIVTLAPAEPRASSEPVQEARNSVTSGWVLYLPAGADVTAQDRFRVRGQVYAVVGEPAAWADAGIVVQLEITKG